MAERALPAGLRAAERLACVAAWSAAALVTGAFLWIVGDVVRHGLGQLSWTFLTAAPERAGRAGGIGTVLVSTAAVLGVCLVAAVPLGLGTALLLAELADTSRRLGGLVRASLDVLAGVPSIVFGLFGSAFFCDALGLGYSILAGGLTLACMVLPLLIRSLELSLRGVPAEYREAGAALDLSRWRLIAHVLLPAAAPGLAAGLLLGIGRATAETAALIFTSGYVTRMPTSLLDSGRTLSIHIYDLAMNVPGGEPNAYATALVLVALLLAVDAAAEWCIARFLARRVSAS
jgi:phosphate transport system permease protein